MTHAAVEVVAGKLVREEGGVPIAVDVATVAGVFPTGRPGIGIDLHEAFGTPGEPGPLLKGCNPSSVVVMGSGCRFGRREVVLGPSLDLLADTGTALIIDSRQAGLTLPLPGLMQVRPADPQAAIDSALRQRARFYTGDIPDTAPVDADSDAEEDAPEMFEEAGFEVDDDGHLVAVAVAEAADDDEGADLLADDARAALTAAARAALQEMAGGQEADVDASPEAVAAARAEAAAEPPLEEAAPPAPNSVVETFLAVPIALYEEAMPGLTGMGVLDRGRREEGGVSVAQLAAAIAHPPARVIHALDLLLQSLRANIEHVGTVAGDGGGEVVHAWEVAAAAERGASSGLSKNAGLAALDHGRCARAVPLLAAVEEVLVSARTAVQDANAAVVDRQAGHGDAFKVVVPAAAIAMDVLCLEMLEKKRAADRGGDDAAALDAARDTALLISTHANSLCALLDLLSNCACLDMAARFLSSARSRAVSGRILRGRVISADTDAHRAAEEARSEAAASASAAVVLGRAARAAVAAAGVADAERDVVMREAGGDAAVEAQAPAGAALLEAAAVKAVASAGNALDRYEADAASCQAAEAAARAAALERDRAGRRLTDVEWGNYIPSPPALAVVEAAFGWCARLLAASLIGGRTTLLLLHARRSLSLGQDAPGVDNEVRGLFYHVRSLPSHLSPPLFPRLLPSSPRFSSHAPPFLRLLHLIDKLHALANGPDARVYPPRQGRVRGSGTGGRGRRPPPESRGGFRARVGPPAVRGDR
jgi:hypothetical protein